MEDEQRQLHAIVSGRVQGVGFRYYTQIKASELGLTGWVRNQYDGTVEVTAEGIKSQLVELLTFLRQGPHPARVTDVKIQWRAPTSNFEDFRIR
jgi:acylphosphatase